MIRQLHHSLALLLMWSAALTASAAGHRFYAVEAEGDTIAEDIEASIRSEIADNVETVTLRLRNNRHTPFQPIKAGLKLGIDTYMDTYPEWYGKYFPTLAVCESDHFYGYMQSPGGKIKAVVSADPIASWSLDYNMGYQDKDQDNRWFYGHRIECLNLDMLCQGPLPEHHPHLWQLAPGEEREWKVKIIDIDNLDAFEPTVYRHTGAPAISMPATSCNPGDSLDIMVWGSAPVMTINGKKLGLKKADTSLWRGTFRAAEPGIKNIVVTDGARQAHGTVAVRHPWRQTMQLARDAVSRYKQKPTSHVESWYGFHTAFDAARILPDPAQDSLLNRRFNLILDKVFDRQTGQPYQWQWRIQNVSSTIGMLADRYLAFGDSADLDLGERMARYFMSFQKPDGAYLTGKTDYTSVIYPAKSLLEFADAERIADRNEQADSLEQSVKRAIEHLVNANGDLQTEGQITYEDGMVSCSALQIGAYALHCKNDADRRRYTEAMLKLLDGHDSLTQLRVPDGRRRGGTLRFWESQYDVFMLPNIISSPHGWSAWRAYATYYAYLLTGDERWLRETFDAASAFAALIDHQTGNLNWAYVVDPYVRATQVCEPDSNHTPDDATYGNPHPELYPNRKFVVGEQYVPMIADWQTIVSSDNDVHECFKFIAEAVLCNAFIVERVDGSIATYNCTLQKDGDTLNIKANEPQITTLYSNLRTPYKLHFDGVIKPVRDPDFYIYLCLGQSNMEGNAPIEPIDRENVSNRFQLMPAVDFPSLSRTKGQWCKAVPPLVHEAAGLSPIDYFGRTMVANLPENVRIGVVPVAVGGANILHLDKDFDPTSIADYPDWYKNLMARYDNTPYKRLVECAREAQQYGVIKGIIFHQGESNDGDPHWPEMVKKLYEDLLHDLSLDAAQVPLLAGEVVSTAEDGACGGMNNIIDRLPETIPTAHVISSANLPHKGDRLHFTTCSYRILGCRYATTLLPILGIHNPLPAYTD